ncbi:MAG TPA: sterol desaturase family protein [Thermoanaerobaculia bacterium]|nr:sterol desaturase family protein [Thermoanaerobaculia bacterium]
MIAFAKRAGVTSGVLGALCVLAELCFRFPHLLVTNDARAFYVAHLELFRGLLLIAIVVTFVLACCSALVLRSKAHSAVGLLLGTVAILLGGPSAAAVTSKPLPVTAGLDYFVLSLLVTALLFVPMEPLWPLHRQQRIFRDGWQTDLAYFFSNHVGVQLLAFVTIVPVQLFFAWAVDGPFQRAVAAQPVWLQFVEILFVVDLTSYWVHRAFHQVPLLWRFHSIHHSIEQLDWLAGSRLHVVDVVVTRLFGFLPMFLLGFAPAAVYGYLIFVSFHAVYIHANISHRWPILRAFFTTPQFHHWHHASEPEAIDKNFAVLLSFIDRMFGTAYQPERWPKQYGVAGEAPPRTFGAQLAFPFKRQ